MLAICDVLVFVLPLVFSAVLLAALHWFPWYNGARILTRLEAYTIGTVVMVGVPATTMVVVYAASVEFSALFWACLLLANTVVCGLTVKGAYWYDSKQAIGRGDAQNWYQH